MGEFIMVSENSKGHYSIPEWAKRMTRAEFRAEYDIATIELHDYPLKDWPQWRSVIRVRDRQHNMRCTLFTTWHPQHVHELKMQGRR